jgi:hypothetical protein
MPDAVRRRKECEVDYMPAGVNVHCRRSIDHVTAEELRR